MRRYAAFFFACLVVHSPLAAEVPLYRGRTVEQWTKDLAHPQPELRVEAAKALAELAPDSEHAIRSLIAALADRSADVRLYAAYALGRMKQQPERCLPALSKLLSDQDEHVRYSAEWALARIADAITTEQRTGQNIEVLNELLNAVESKLNMGVARAEHLRQVQQARESLKMASVHSPAKERRGSNISGLLQDLRADDELAQLRAIESLKQRGAVVELVRVWESAEQGGFLDWHVSRALAEMGEPAVPELSSALSHENEEVSYQAAHCLRQMGPRAGSSLPKLIALIEDSTLSDDGRETAIWVVESIGPSAKDAAEPLARLFRNDESDTLLEASARALAALGPAAGAAVPGLIEVVRDDDLTDETRIAVAEALASIAADSRDALQILLTLLHQTEDPFLLGGLSDAIGRFGPRAVDAVPRLMAIVAETSDDSRQSAVRALGEIGPRANESLPLLIEQLTAIDEYASVQVAAAVAIGNLGPDSVQALAEQLKHPETYVRETVARALVEIGAQAEPAGPALLTRLADPKEDEEVRALAAVALGQIRIASRDTVATLTGLVRDPESPVYLRSMAAVALGQIDPDSAPSLVEGLRDPNLEFRIAAAYSLQRMHPPHPDGLLTLVDALSDEDSRSLAIPALEDLGDVCLPLLTDTLKDVNQDIDMRLAVLQVISQFGDEAISHLLRALNDEELAEAAYWHLRDFGNDAIPHLLAADTASFSEAARLQFRELVEDLYGGIGGGDGEAMWSGGHALTERPGYANRKAAGGAAMAAPRMAAAATAEPFIMTEPEEMMMPEPEPEPDIGFEPERDPKPAPIEPSVAAELEANGYKTVKVFYGTNRKPLDEPQNQANLAWYHWLAILTASASLIFFCIGWFRRGATVKAVLGVTAIVLLCLLFVAITTPDRKLQRTLAKHGPTYGGEYRRTVDMGYCEVTIPDIHQEGQLEGISLLRLQLREDPQKHVVLKSVHRLERDVFFEDLHSELQQRGNSILIFIHGYNVSFEDASRRTAQMSNDLRFAGAPIFYSWPSQAKWQSYRVDEKNVELSVDQLKEFLIDIAERSAADTVNLIAHSMGNRALTNALKEIEVSAIEEEKLFNQVILAAPDIDADIFKQRIAPAIVQRARHVTLYASSGDLALVASRKFNSGDPRAGDAGDDLVVVPGIETIDVSAGDSSLLGHSYYGDSTSVLRDIELLLRNQPAASREFLAPVPRESPSYWLFQPMNTARREISTTPR
jgi:esterase/lipase superfamily enzyme/HEAT repeat protein